MRKLLVIVLLLGMIGCAGKKGADGKDGVNGIAGMNGTNGKDITPQTFTGAITSDIFTITLSQLDTDEMPVVNVYGGTGNGEWVEISVYNASNGGNVVAVLSRGKVVIWYAPSNGLTRYYIVIAGTQKAGLLNRLL